MALYSLILDVNSNFWTLFDQQDQTSEFIFLMIFGTHTFSKDKNVIKFIYLLPFAQNK